MKAELFAIAVAFVIGVYLGLMCGTVGARSRVHAELVKEGVGAYVVDPATGEVAIKWAKLAEVKK